MIVEMKLVLDDRIDVDDLAAQTGMLLLDAMTTFRDARVPITSSGLFYEPRFQRPSTGTWLVTITHV